MSVSQNPLTVCKTLWKIEISTQTEPLNLFDEIWHEVLLKKSCLHINYNVLW